MDVSQVIQKLQQINDKFKQSNQTPKSIDSTLGRIGILDNNAYYQNLFTNYLNIKRISYSNEIVDSLQMNISHDPEAKPDIIYLRSHPSEFAYILDVKKPLKPSDVSDAIDFLITKLKQQPQLANQNYNFKLKTASTGQDVKLQFLSKLHTGLWVIAVLVFLWLCWKLYTMLF